MSTSNYPEDSDATRKLIASRAIVATRTKKIPDHSPPERIDRYRVLRQLGVGSFGNVYLAQDEFLERDVAIKVAHQATSDDNTLLAEARIAAKLDHPNIVTVFDIGRTNIDHEFIVSKFVDGADLCTLLQDGRLPVPDVVRIVSTIAAALDYSHRQSVIHRDIKPANILIDTEGTPFVADFGVATEQCNVVATGSKLIGSPLYMSPEQVQRDWFLLDARTDIFSLGVVLYEMLAGTPPFVANSIEELASQITNDIPTSLTTVNPAVPTKLQAVCSKAMHKARSERFQSAADFSEALQNTTEKNRCTISQPIAIAWEEHEQTVVEAEARRSLPRGRLRLLLRCFALLAAIVCGLTVLGLYLTKKDQAKLQLEAVEQLESHGGTVIYDYQLRPNGNVTLTAKPTQSWFGGRDWSHNVVRAYIGAKLQAYDFDGESVEVVVPNKLECPLDPLRQLKGLQDLSVHRYVDEAELEALTKLTQLKSIRFFVQPHSAVIDGLRKHLPNCDIQ